ncbi:spore germination protein, partial [Clostridium perfringens]
YFDHLVDIPTYEQEILLPLQHAGQEGLQELLRQSRFVQTTDTVKAVKGVLDGKVALFLPEGVYLVNVYNPEKRSIQQSESESAITGPHDAFIEMIETNLSLIRRKLKSNRLKVIQLNVGELTKTKVAVLYVDGIAKKEFVDNMVERIKAIEFNSLYDGTMLMQMIDDFPNSLFPQFQTSERPD